VQRPKPVVSKIVACSMVYFTPSKPKRIIMRIMALKKERWVKGGERVYGEEAGEGGGREVGRKREAGKD
jgi:hypothetical protein